MIHLIILRFADVGVEKRSKEKSKRGTREEDSLSISINKTWLSVADGYLASKDDQVPDLRTFWKGEGNATSVREARGEYIVARYDSYDFFLSKFLATALQ